MYDMNKLYCPKPTDSNFSNNIYQSHLDHFDWLTDTASITNRPLIACRGVLLWHLFLCRGCCVRSL